MPSTDGIELATKIKPDTLTANIPVILLSAIGSEEQQLEGLSMDVNDISPNRFTFEILALKIRNLITQQKTVAEKNSKRRLKSIPER